MKRNHQIAFDVHEQNANKRAKLSQPLPTLPKDMWGVILNFLSVYDIIFVRASSSWLYKLCKEFRPFPKHFSRDLDVMASYLVENGFVSCLDYIKHTFNFELTCGTHIRSSRCFEVLKDGLSLQPYKHNLYTTCTVGTCNIDMIKYLHSERGEPWERSDGPDSYYKYTMMENMAYHGHVECMKYALERGCKERMINYTPSIECLDLAIRHGFNWRYSEGKKNICEQAARLGDLTILQYAHQKGAPLVDSAVFAARQGHLECLKYALENGVEPPLGGMRANTLACFEYLVKHYGLEELKSLPRLWAEQACVGNMDILRFMLQHKFPLPKDSHGRDCILKEALLSRVEVLKFFVYEAKIPLLGTTDSHLLA